MIIPQNLELEWLYLDVNSYFATIEQQINPDLRNKPIAVVAVMTDSTCAIAASYHAKLKGIKTGTPIYQAKKLCPELICVLARHDVYVDFHHRILNEIDKYSYVDHLLSIDECACKLTGELKKEDEAIKLAKKIKQGIKNNVGNFITCSIGISTNKFLAKVATEMQKPDGLVVIKPEDIPKKLYSLKLRDIPGIGANTYKRLIHAGVITIEDLYEQDTKSLGRIWGGVVGERCWYALRGVQLPDILTKNHSIGNSQVLAPSLRGALKAREVALRLLQKAAARLRRQNFQATRQTLVLELESGEILKNSVSFNHTTDSFSLIGKLTESWDILTRELKEPKIKKISITFSGLTKAAELQPELFAETQDKKDTNKLLSVIDALNKKFGKDTVSIGTVPNEGKDIATTKIAFSRIPDKEEFFE
jgi:DNA polymerase-4